MVIDEGLKIGLLDEGKVAGDDEPVGVRIVMEGRLKAAEGTWAWFEVGESGLLARCGVAMGNGQKDIIS